MSNERQVPSESRDIFEMPGRDSFSEAGSWLAVVDPWLRGVDGHFIPLAIGCLRAARLRGLKTLLVCGASAPDFLNGEADDVQRVFAAPPGGGIPLLAGLARRRWLDQGARAIRFPEDGGPVTLVVPTFTADFSRNISRSLSDPLKVRGIITLFHGIPEGWRARMDYRHLAEVRVPVVHGLFHRSFRKGMNNSTGIRHIGLPHPFDWSGFERAPERAGGRDTILFAGSLRMNKGAAEIVALIRHLLPDAERLGFRILCYAASKNKACRPILEELEQIRRKHPALALRTVAATESEMREDYRRAAVAVLSYEPEAYRHKTSGIQMEATVAGAPLAVSCGTHMERLIREGHAAGVAVDYHDKEAWRRGIVKILESGAEYQEAARACSNWWRTFWNGDRFLRHGLKAIEATASMRRKTSVS